MKMLITYDYDKFYLSNVSFYQLWSVMHDFPHVAPILLQQKFTAQAIKKHLSNLLPVIGIWLSKVEKSFDLLKPNKELRHLLDRSPIGNMCTLVYMYVHM